MSGLEIHTDGTSYYKEANQMGVYEKCPVYMNEQYQLRLVDVDDASGLLKVYSDPEAKRFFNSDNCSGGFSFDTLEMVREAIAGWRGAYEQRAFVRWSIIERKVGEVIGTIELFHRDAEDAFSNTGLLRLDLRSDQETEEKMVSILGLILEPAYVLFNCASITTKAIPTALARRSALCKLGFEQSDELLIGHDGTAYSSYFVRFRDA